MFSLIGTLIFYDLVIFLCFVLANGYKKSYAKGFKYIPYIILLLVSCLRYDIGTDYSGTYLDVYDRLHTRGGLAFEGLISDSIKSPGEWFLSVVFSHFPDPSVWVINTYFIIFIVYIYKILDDYNAHKWGLLCIFLSLIIFQAWDWSKQYAAVAILAYSIKYIQQGKYIKFLLLFLASFILHLSTIFFLPLLLLRKLKLSPKLLALVLFGVFIVAQTGFFRPFYQGLVGLAPMYSESYLNSMLYGEFGEGVVGTASYTFYCIWFIVLLFFSQKQHNIWNVMLFVGALLYIVSENSLVLDRVAVYYLIAQIVIFPMIMSTHRKGAVNTLMIILVMINLLLLNRRFMEENDLRGCVPYESLFSSEYKHGVLRENN